MPCSNRLKGRQIYNSRVYLCLKAIAIYKLKLNRQYSLILPPEGMCAGRGALIPGSMVAPSCCFY
ncbi:hypothetical protein LB504_000001 [Fusarium proliferatum]|nr:hypothetical protein LB504_000001 [Fusarium proliferatum]